MPFDKVIIVNGEKTPEKMQEQRGKRLLRKLKNLSLFFALLLFSGVGGSIALVIIFLFHTQTIPDQEFSKKLTGKDVLAAAVEQLNLLDKIQFDVPAVFNDTATFNSDIIFKGKKIDFGSAALSGNLLTSITAGSGITVTGSQAPTITNSDPGSAQNIFKTVTVGGTSFSAGSNKDTLTLSAGSGISLSSDTGSKTVTIAQQSGGSGSFSSVTASGLISANGGVTLGSSQSLTLSGLTSGSIPYINSSQQLVDDNTNLFWDATNKRLGIGINSPAAGLHIAEATSLFGVGEGGTPTSTTIRGAAAAGNSVQGANLTIAASNGTGTAGSGDLIFQTAPPSNTTLTFDSASSTSTTSQVSSLTWTHTTTTSSNRIMIVGVTSTFDESVSSVTYGGQNLTKINGLSCGSSSCRVEMWYLLNPPTGSNSVVVTFAFAENNVAAGASTYYNVDQINPLGTAVSAVGNQTTPSTTVTSTTQQVVVDAVAINTNQTWIPGSGQTQVYQVEPNLMMSAGSYKTGLAGTTTMTWSASGNANWGQIAVPINQVANTSPDNLADRLHITSAGNIGIGTALPKDLLDVEGGNIMIGQQTNTGAAAETAWTKVTQSSAGTIANGGTASIASISAMAVYNGSLYVGTHKSGAAEVYRYDGTSGNWTKISQNTAGTIKASGTAAIDEVSSMTVYNGNLYIGTSKTDKAEVYRYDGGTTWTIINTTAGTFDNSLQNIDGVTSMTVNAGKLYIGTTEPTTARVYRYNGSTGSNVFLSVGNQFSNADTITALASYNDMLWAASSHGDGQAMLFRFLSGSTWSNITTNTSSCAGAVAGDFCINGGRVSGYTAVTSMVVYNGRLYVGLRKLGGGGDLMYLEETGTNQISAPNNEFVRILNAQGQVMSGGTSSIDSVSSVAVYNGKLYAGTEKANGAEIYRYEGGIGAGSSWTKISQAAGTIASGGTGSIDMVSNLVPYNGSLYAGTYEPGSAEVYNYTVVSDQSYALKFHAGASEAGGEQNSFLNVGSINFIASSSASTNTGGGSGTFLFSHGIQTNFSAYDIAEDYGTRDDSLQAGDIVAMDSNESTMVKKASVGESIVGIYSEKPGLRLSQQDATINGGRAIPVALAGRVPVKVSTENGAIHIGDLLTVSSVPGVAMKATKAGFIVGRAFENYENSDKTSIGKVMAFVNISWADPTLQITQSGDLNLAQTSATDSAIISPTGSNLQALSGQPLTTINQNYNPQIANLTTSLTDLQQKVASITAQMTKVSQINDFSKRIADLEKTVNLSQALQESSSSSAILGTSTENTTVDGKFTVLGRATLSDLGVTGKIIAGLLAIDGMDTELGTMSASINTISGPLNLQPQAIAGVDILHGKITIDTNGNMVSVADITAKHIKADTYEVNQHGDSASAGKAVLPAEKTSIEISTSALTNTSLIFATPEDTPIGISTKKTGDKTFVIKIKDPQTQDVKINWWIVN